VIDSKGNGEAAFWFPLPLQKKAGFESPQPNSLVAGTPEVDQ
jgi:hypothetical protein